MNKLIIQSVRAHLDENQKLLNDLLKAQSELEANYDFFGLPEEDKKKDLQQLKSSTQGSTKQIFIPGAEHGNILTDPTVVSKLAKMIAKYY